MITQELSTLYPIRKLYCIVDATNQRMAVGASFEYHYLKLALGQPNKFAFINFCTNNVRAAIKTSVASSFQEGIGTLMQICFWSTNCTVEYFTSDTGSWTNLSSYTILLSPYVTLVSRNLCQSGYAYDTSSIFVSRYASSSSPQYFLATMDDDLDEQYANEDYAASEDEDDSEDSESYTSADQGTGISAYIYISRNNGASAPDSVTETAGIPTAYFTGASMWKTSTSRYCEHSGYRDLVISRPLRYSNSLSFTTCGPNDEDLGHCDGKKLSRSAIKARRVLHYQVTTMQPVTGGVHDASTLWQRFSCMSLTPYVANLLAYRAWCARFPATSLDDVFYTTTGVSSIFEALMANLDPFISLGIITSWSIPSDVSLEMEECDSLSTLTAWADGEDSTSETFSIKGLTLTPSVSCQSRANWYFIYSGANVTYSPLPYTATSPVQGEITASDPTHNWYGQYALRYHAVSEDSTVTSYYPTMSKPWQVANVTDTWSLYPIWSSGLGMLSLLCFTSKTLNAYPVSVRNVNTSTATNTGIYLPWCFVQGLGYKGKIYLDADEYYKHITGYYY